MGQSFPVNFGRMIKRVGQLTDSGQLADLVGKYYEPAAAPDFWVDNLSILVRAHGIGDSLSYAVGSPDVSLKP